MGPAANHAQAPCEADVNSTRTADAPPAPLEVTGALPLMVQALEAGLLERAVAARLVLLAAVAGEHVLLIGPPGTAKSELARRLQLVIEPEGMDGHSVCFERLLTRFSTPEELFGPLSLKALEDDRYERLVQGYLPTAQVAFLDEVFKANSAILNALLTLLHERVFDNGTARIPVPLVTVVGASNETPGDEALQAFHDRFLIRVPVEPVSEMAFEQLVTGAATTTAPPPRRLTVADRAAVAGAAQAVTLSAQALDALRELRTPQTRVSDRRWRQLGRLLRVAAAAEGRSVVEPTDLWLAAFIAAAEPAQVHTLLQWWQQRVLRLGEADAPGWRHTVEAFEKQLEIETRAQAEDGADTAGKLALARSLGGADGQGASSEMLRLYSARVEDSLRKRWSPLHVRARVGQVQALREPVQRALDDARERLIHLEAQLLNRLWLPQDLALRSLQPLRQRAALLNDLLGRLQACEAGFAALPMDEALSDVPLPMPVTA